MTRALLAALIFVTGSALAWALYRQEPRGTMTATLQPTHSAPVARIQSAVPAARPVAALPETLEWPDEEPRVRSKAIAYAALFRAWGVGYQGGDACMQAEGLGLRCRTARGGLDDLRQFNRPAVLQMRDAAGQYQGQSYPATLTGLDDKTATFAIGTRTRTVALGALAAQWSGHYTLLWRMLPDAPKSILPGERGPAVEWLDRQLAQVQGRAGAPPTVPVFDDALGRRLKQFQLAQGLVPDGAPGPQTLTRLSSVADQAAPKLLREQGAR